MKTRCASALGLASCLLLARLLAAAPSSPPDTPEGRRVRALLAAFDAGRPDALRAFVSANFAASALAEVPLEQRVQRLGNMAQQAGPLEFDRIVRESGTEIAFLARSKKSGQWVEVGMRLEPGPPRGILGLLFQPSDGPAAAHPGKAGSDAEAAAAAHALLLARVAAGEFSGVALIAHDGRPIFQEAVGLADRAFSVPNRTDTRFNVGSIGKAFTQVAIAQLAAQGKIAFTDTIRKHLPDYPSPAADRITIQQLVTMTSGLGDVFGEKYDATPKDRLRTLADYLPLFAGEPLLFEPGAGRSYSNAGYVVLGLIVEKVSGESYSDYVRDHVFTPAGMTDTGDWPQDAVVPNRAVGYTRERGGDREPGAEPGGRPETERPNLYALPARASSAGGAYSTALDLLRFDQALRGDRLLSREYGDWFFSGKANPPAAGVRAAAASRPARAGGFGIAGGTAGANAVLETDLDTGYTIVVLSNLDPPSAESLGRLLRELLGLK